MPAKNVKKYRTRTGDENDKEEMREEEQEKVKNSISLPLGKENTKLSMPDLNRLSFGGELENIKEVCKNKDKRIEKKKKRK